MKRCNARPHTAQEADISLPFVYLFSDHLCFDTMALLTDISKPILCCSRSAVPAQAAQWVEVASKGGERGKKRSVKCPNSC